MTLLFLETKLDICIAPPHHRNMPASLATAQANLYGISVICLNIPNSSPLKWEDGFLIKDLYATMCSINELMLLMKIFIVLQSFVHVYFTIRFKILCSCWCVAFEQPTSYLFQCLITKVSTKSGSKEHWNEQKYSEDRSSTPVRIYFTFQVVFFL